jgi:hypothetical protein
MIAARPRNPNLEMINRPMCIQYFWQSEAQADGDYAESKEPVYIICTV